MGDTMGNVLGEFRKPALPVVHLLCVKITPVLGKDVIQRKDEPVWILGEKVFPLRGEAIAGEYIRPGLG